MSATYSYSIFFGDNIDIYQKITRDNLHFVIDYVHFNTYFPINPKLLSRILGAFSENETLGFLDRYEKKHKDSLKHFNPREVFELVRVACKVKRPDFFKTC